MANLPTSYRVVELIRAKISNKYLRASDTEISRVLAVSRAAISAYKGGRAVMGLSTLSRAQDVLDLPGRELAAIQADLAVEAATTPEARRILTAVRDAVRGVAASILLALAILAGSAFGLGNTARAAPSSADHSRDGLYIMRMLRRRRRRRGCRILARPQRRSPICARAA